MTLIKVMKDSLYKEILSTIESLNCWESDACLNSIAKSYPGVCFETLRSILCQDIQKKYKKTFHKKSTPKVKDQAFNDFVRAVNEGDPPGIIVEIAKSLEFSPALVGRSILEESAKDRLSKTKISSLLKCTTSIEDKDLSYELFLSQIKDDMFGRIAESIKHSIGQEYEQLVKDTLRSKGIEFQDENQLRGRGYDKTPDVKLEVPIAVNGTIVNWIESKALFGDEDSHKGYLRDQLWSYWNRFGPGLVIYWFGYIEELNRESGNILLSDSFPENIVLFKP